MCSGKELLSKFLLEFSLFSLISLIVTYIHLNLHLRILLSGSDFFFKAHSWVRLTFPQSPPAGMFKMESKYCINNINNTQVRRALIKHA